MSDIRAVRHTLRLRYLDYHYKDIGGLDGYRTLLLRKIGQKMASQKIVRFFRKYFFLPFPINPEFHMDIPGRFVIRFYLTADNLVTEEPTTSSSSSTTNDHFVPEAVLEGVDLDLMHALAMSMEKPVVSTPVSTHPEGAKYRVAYDLRVLSTGPDRIIELFGNKYKLTSAQKDRLSRVWSRVNPGTSSGIQFVQNTAYQKALNSDRIKAGLYFSS